MRQPLAFSLRSTLLLLCSNLSYGELIKSLGSRALLAVLDSLLTSMIATQFSRRYCGSSSTSSGDASSDAFPTFSSTTRWRSIEGAINRLIFACTMGVVAVVLLSVLWVVSLPWIAWRIFRWRFPRVRERMTACRQVFRSSASRLKCTYTLKIRLMTPWSWL